MKEKGKKLWKFRLIMTASVFFIFLIPVILISLFFETMPYFLLVIIALLPLVITIILFEKLNPLIRKRIMKTKEKGKNFVMYDKEEEHWERKH